MEWILPVKWYTRRHTDMRAIAEIRSYHSPTQCAERRRAPVSS